MNRHAHDYQSALNPEAISRVRKERYLLSMSEDDFRDKAVRPVFLFKGFSDGRELCGPTEEGKDTLFVETNKLGMRQVWVVQTKKGNLDLSSKVKQNVIIATTQLKTALQTKVTFLETKEKIFPNYVLLCASGKINDAARSCICTDINDPRIVFMDKESIIPLIDKFYPEFWLGIDADRFPYLRRLRDFLLKFSDTITLSEMETSKNTITPITDDMYVQLYLHRLTTKTIKYKGKPYTEPKVEQFPAQAVLTRRENLIHIVGEAGTGKTTALRRFAYSICEKSLSDASITIIPVIVKCADIASSDKSLLELAVNLTQQFTLSNKPSFSDKDLNEGNVLFFIDALDEVPKSNWSNVVSKILDFHDRQPACKIILTSRNYASINSLPELVSFTKFTLTPIDLGQARKLVEHLSRGRSLPASQTNEMLRQLHQVHGLELNPLLVTVFVATSDYSRRDIPANITELFKKFTEMMLGRWDQKKGLSQQYQDVVKDFLLKKLAFFMHTNNLSSIQLEVCRNIFKNELEIRGHACDLDTLFEEIVHRSGLFRFEDDQIIFRHALLQEFFAGRGIPSIQFLAAVVAEEQWKHSLVFYFGEHPDAYNDLLILIEGMAQYEGVKLYKAAVTIGLAIQACYLAKVSEKTSSMEAVIASLAKAQDGFVSELTRQNPALPLSAFLSYYIFARDSVACEQIKTQIETSARELLEKNDAESELKAFWNIVSLLESGSLAQAEILIKSFKPKDLKLLMALHLGCFLIEKLRITSQDEARIAGRICEFLSPKTSVLRESVMKEMKSILIEARKGKLHALPMGDVSSEQKQPKKN
jgi:hypothetical protein